MDSSTPNDPLLSTASSLMSLGITPRETDVTLRDQVSQMLKHHVMQIERDDFSGMEMLLTCQAQLLHRIFTQAAEKYASDTANPLHHATIALTAQSHCRLTIHTLKYMKSQKSARKKRGTNWKEIPYETLD